MSFGYLSVDFLPFFISAWDRRLPLKNAENSRTSQCIELSRKNAFTVCRYALCVYIATGFISPVYFRVNSHVHTL